MLKQRKASKVQELRELGWSKEDFKELLVELGDALFEDNLFAVDVNVEKNTTNFLKDLGFNLNHNGSQFLRDAIIFCKKERIRGFLKSSFYDYIEEKYDIGRSRVQESMREEIKYAFKVPTEYAKKIFSQQIADKGHPNVRGLIAEALDYV